MFQTVHNRNTRRDPSNPVKFTLLSVFASKGLVNGPVFVSGTVMYFSYTAKI